jgi:hypothetical protein
MHFAAFASSPSDSQTVSVSAEFDLSALTQQNRPGSRIRAAKELRQHKMG